MLLKDYSASNYRGAKSLNNTILNWLVNWRILVVKEKKIVSDLEVSVGIFYYLIIFQYHYVGKYHNNNYISYLSIVSLN